MQIRKIEKDEIHLVIEAKSLFDHQPKTDATARFLDTDTHHLFIAYEDGVPAGFISSVEMTHPDKGTEMFIYELGVDERFRRNGIGSALVERIRALATQLGCYGMWVLTDADNKAAIATYSKLSPNGNTVQTMIDWKL